MVKRGWLARCVSGLAAGGRGAFPAAGVFFGLILTAHAAAGATLDLPGGVKAQPYLALDGKEIPADAVMVSRSDSAIRAEFTAPADGTYRFGLAMESAEIAPLIQYMPKQTAKTLAEPKVWRYPYDWTYQGQGNVLGGVHLIMPGILAGGKVYLVDTHELFSIAMAPAGKDVRALLLQHRFYNDGADEATADLQMKSGEKQAMTVAIYDDVAASNRARFGVGPEVKGDVVQFVYRWWGTIEFTEEEYSHAPPVWQGVINYVICRDTITREWIPKLFHARGIKAFQYQYLGALRAGSPQMTDELENEIGMKDVKGARYSAPVAPNGSWTLGDIRRPEIRKRFVDNAVQALDAGFDGVFLDGHPFWVDTTGRVGGNVPKADHSLAWARWKLLAEMHAAMRAKNPDSLLSILGNQYYDTLGECDWIMKEIMYGGWSGFRGTHGSLWQVQNYGSTLKQDQELFYEDGQAPFISKSLAYGMKGISPICAQSEIHSVRRPTGFVYSDAGDFLPWDLDKWIDAQAAIVRQTDFYIKKVTPISCRIYFNYLNVVHADTDCTLEFNRPGWVVWKAGERPEKPVEQIALKGKQPCMIFGSRPRILPVTPLDPRTADKTPLYIAVNPDTARIGKRLPYLGYSTDADCTVEFSRPVCVVPSIGGRHQHKVLRLRMKAGVDYDIYEQCVVELGDAPESSETTLEPL